MSRRSPTDSRGLAYNASLHSDYVRGRTYELSFVLPL